MCSDTLNPGGEVRGCCVGCILGMPEISPFVFIAASYQLHGISRTKEMLFQAGVFWVRRNFLVFWLARNRYFVSAPFDAGLNVMPHTASRRSLLSAVRSSSSRRRLARSSTRRVLWYHALTESSMSSTTGQPRNRTAEKDEAALARK